MKRLARCLLLPCKPCILLNAVVVVVRPIPIAINSLQPVHRDLVQARNHVRLVALVQVAIAINAFSDGVQDRLFAQHVAELFIFEVVLAVELVGETGGETVDLDLLQVKSPSI